MLLPLLETLPEVPRAEQPILFACENDHAAVKKLKGQLGGRVFVVDCMVDRVCTGRTIEATGVDVFGYEYFGYSVAPGQPSEAGCARCIDAAYAHLVRERRYRPERVVLFGRSIGSVPTVDLAARCDRGGLGGVVLQVRERARHPQSPFPSSPGTPPPAIIIMIH